MSGSFIAGCLGKMRYETWRDANTAMVRLRQRAGDGEYGQPKAYHCRHCGGFHYGRDRDTRKLDGQRKRNALKWEVYGV